jgi:hypothetical protein
MRVLITDVTRMQPGYICVAGIELTTHARIRPVLPCHTRLPLTWVASQGGKIDYKRVLEIGDGARVGNPPEVEDVLTSDEQIVLVDILPDDQFLEVLNEVSVADARATIGPELKRHVNGHNFVTPQGRGDCSLVLQEAPPGSVEVAVDGFGQIRASWDDGMRLSVTDLRLYELDGKTVKQERVTRVNELLQQQAGFVAFGLTRPWSNPRSGDPAWYHWLQVNAIHVPGALDWEL